MANFRQGETLDMVNRYSYRHPFGWPELDWVDQPRAFGPGRRPTHVGPRTVPVKPSATGTVFSPTPAVEHDPTVSAIEAKSPQTRATDIDRQLAQLEQELAQARANEARLLAEFKNYRRQSAAANRSAWPARAPRIRKDVPATCI